MKELRFSWNAVSGAEFYRLFENPDGVSGFSQLGGDLTTLSFNHPISLHRRVNASYSVHACNGAGCTASTAVTPDLAQAIGYFKASNTVRDDQFGWSVALSADGNTMAVGAPFERGGAGVVTPFDGPGAVYVFTRSAGGWSQQAFLKALNQGVADNFGWSVALSADGNTLAVGAPHENSSTTGVNNTSDEAAANAGAVYVFIGSAGIWSQQAYVKASNTGAGDVFGVSVALSGDGNTLAVGAPAEDSGTTGVNSTPDEAAFDAGAVYVFSRTTGVWSQQAYVKASNTALRDAFGISVALSGDGNTLAVGAILENSGTGGATYVYIRSLGGVWSQEAYVKPSNTNTIDDSFGRSVVFSSDGNTLAVGAPGERSSGTGVNSTPTGDMFDAGAAYVFIRSSGVWSQQAYVKASNTGSGDNFGASIALSADGNMLAVGAPGENGGGTGVASAPNEGATDAGAVYVFIRSAGVWSQQAYVKASNPGGGESSLAGSGGDGFGGAVALSGDGNTLMVGAAREDSSTTGVSSTPDESARNAGAVYLY
jgi:hypothetical protein